MIPRVNFARLSDVFISNNVREENMNSKKKKQYFTNTSNYDAWQNVLYDAHPSPYRMLTQSSPNPRILSKLNPSINSLLISVSGVTEDTDSVTISKRSTVNFNSAWDGGILYFTLLPFSCNFCYFSSPIVQKKLSLCMFETLWRFTKK